MRISDWSSDVCSSDLEGTNFKHVVAPHHRRSDRVAGGRSVRLADRIAAPHRRGTAVPKRCAGPGRPFRDLPPSLARPQPADAGTRAGTRGSLSFAPQPANASFWQVAPHYV